MLLDTQTFKKLKKAGYAEMRAFCERLYRQGFEDGANADVEFCVTQIDYDGYLYGVGRDGGTYSGKNPKDWEKTGRHTDIDSFLKQIGEE